MKEQTPDFLMRFKRMLIDAGYGQASTREKVDFINELRKFLDCRESRARADEHEEKEGLKENKRNARAFLKNMHITDMRVFAESMDRDTTGLTTSQVKALLMQMAHDFAWMPDPPKTEAAHNIKEQP